MNVPEEIRRKLEFYAFAHGGHFDIGASEDRVRVAVEFHPHTFSLGWIFAEDLFRKCGLDVELRPSPTDRIVEPNAEHVVQMFYEELRRFAQEHGGRFICERDEGNLSFASPINIYADFADEQAAVDWLEEMITVLFIPAVAIRWSRLNQAKRMWVLKDGAVLGG